MKTSAITETLIGVALSTAGYVAGQKLGNMVPATTGGENRDYMVGGGKIAVGIAVVMLAPKSMAKYTTPLAVGIATEGTIQVLKKAAPTLGITGSRGAYRRAVRGWDNGSAAIMGSDNGGNALMGYGTVPNAYPNTSPARGGAGL